MIFTKTSHHRNENEDERCNCSIPQYGKTVGLISQKRFHIVRILSREQFCHSPKNNSAINSYGLPYWCIEEVDVDSGDQTTSKQSAQHELKKPKSWISQNIQQEDK